jgi:hypothetical protein
LEKSVFSSIAVFIYPWGMVFIISFATWQPKKMGMYVKGPERFFLEKFTQSHHTSRDKKSSQITQYLNNPSVPSSLLPK